jgi:hypothetical protein
MKNEITGNADIPLSWLKDLKQSNNANTSTTKNTNKTDNIKITDFSKRLSKLKEENPDILQDLIKTARNNYK